MLTEAAAVTANVCMNDNRILVVIEKESREKCCLYTLPSKEDNKEGKLCNIRK